jgi:hypothetical protein
MNLILQGGALPTFLLERILAATGASTVELRPPQVVCLKEAGRTAEFEALVPLIEAEKLDWAFVEAGRKLSDFGLICFDMDSTLITIECIDELADFAGKKDEVSAVAKACVAGWRCSPGWMPACWPAFSANACCSRPAPANCSKPARPPACAPPSCPAVSPISPSACASNSVSTSRPRTNWKSPAAS